MAPSYRIIVNARFARMTDLKPDPLDIGITDHLGWIMSDKP
jgi:hypothetical protein